jgi:hypothetical protein
MRWGARQSSAQKLKRVATMREPHDARRGRATSVFMLRPVVEARERDGARFIGAAVIGSLVALVLDLWMLDGPDHGLLESNGLLGSFYDVQGRALLDGHLDVDPAQVSIEGFRVDGKTYTYFGLVPTLLRLPVQVATHDLDGKLTQVSMLLGFIVLLAAGAHLHWRVRVQLRPGAAVQRVDLVAAALMQVALGAGAIPLYLASRSVVYHEAELWGAAFTIAATAAVLAVMARPTPRTIAWAGVLTALAVNTRFSVGLGPVAALGLLAAVELVRLWRGRGGERRTVALLVAAAVVPLALHAAVNMAKFDQPFGIPIDKQVQSRVEPNRRAALAANDGTIFGLKFVPTTLVQAVRPDALGRQRAFPFVGVPHEPATVVGGVTFDTIEPSLSAPTSMPLLCVLMLVGLVGLIRRRDQRLLLAVLLATAASFVLTLTIAFVTTRYLADFLPFLLLGGLIGLQLLFGATARRGLVLLAVAALTAVGIAVNGATGIIEQRLFYEATESERAAFVETQDDVDGLLDRRPRGVRSGPRLPDHAPGVPGDLFVVGDCAALYVEGLHRDWLPVERTPRGGAHRLSVRFPRSSAAREEPLLTLGTGPRRVVVTARPVGELTAFAVRVGDSTVASGRPRRVERSRPVPVIVSVDRFSGGTFAAVDVSGRRAVTGLVPDVSGSAATLGADPPRAQRFSGSVRRVGGQAPTCRAVTSY